MIITAINGFCMALADSVPGVSGGTIAFILGFYEQFLTALHDLFGRDREARRLAVKYLLKLCLGWVIGMTFSVLLLSKALENDIYFLSSLFMGLTVASLPFIIISERDVVAGRYVNSLYALLGAAIVVVLTIVRSYTSASSVDYLAIQPLQYLYMIVAAAISMTAMVLPGISGSTLMLIFGLYAPTITALRQLISLNFAVLPGLLTLVLGAAIGVALSIHFIREAFSKHRSETVYLVIGLIVGSLYAIIMGPSTLSNPQPPIDASSFSIPGFLVGAGVLVGLEFMRKAMEKNSRNA